MLVASLILLALGVAMLVRGLVGRRVGTEPRCRKCKYDLTNLTSDRCPECGAELSTFSPVVGVRRRRRNLVAVGLFVTLVAAGSSGLLGFRAWSGVNWYSYLPLSWVVGRAEAGSAGAMSELTARWNRGGLSSSQLCVIARAAIRAQRKLPLDPNLDFWGQILKTDEVLEALGPAEQTAYMNALQNFTLVVPKCRRTGETLPVVIRYTRLPRPSPSAGVSYEDGWYYSIESGKVALEDADAVRLKTSELSSSDRQSVGIGSYYGNWAALQTDNVAPGEYSIAVNFKRRMYRRGVDARPPRENPWSDEVTLRARVRIESADSPPCITETTDPEVAKELLARLQYVRDPGPDDGKYHGAPWVLRVQFPLPCALAGTFYLKTPQTELKMETKVYSRQPYVPGGLAISGNEIVRDPAASLFADASNEFTLIFRSDPKLALTRPDIDQIWAADLVIDHYVQPDRATSQPNSTPYREPAQLQPGSTEN